MKILFSVLAFLMVTGCVTRAEMKSMKEEIQKEMAAQRQPDVVIEGQKEIVPILQGYSTTTEVKRMINDEMGYHKRNYPHGCEVNCK